MAAKEPAREAQTVPSRCASHMNDSPQWRGAWPQSIYADNLHLKVCLLSAASDSLVLRLLCTGLDNHSLPGASSRGKAGDECLGDPQISWGAYWLQVAALKPLQPLGQPDYNGGMVIPEGEGRHFEEEKKSKYGHCSNWLR